MGPLIISLIVVGIIVLILLSGYIFAYFYTLPIAKRLYSEQWVRKDNSHFQRGCSDKGFDYHLDMFNQGMEIRNKYLNNIKEVEVTSLGINLKGEYYDFGYEKAIIIIPGRMETAYYGAYYVGPLKRGGYNVLCIDPRAHGLSEGDKITLGLLEGLDAIAWARYLHDELNNKSIALYGICGGATASLIALNDKNCPTYVNLLITDGMFPSFVLLYKRHIKDEKKPVYPVLTSIMHLIKKYNGVNPYKMKPKKMIKSINVPVLFLSGSKDIFALPIEAKKMYESCPSSDKKFALIIDGRHSHLRYDNKKEYDNVVIDFLKNH